MDFRTHDYIPLTRFHYLVKSKSEVQWCYS